MQVRGAGEALFIACEMEKRAIRLYERALALFADSPCQEAIRAILGDERNHLRQFSQNSRFTSTRDASKQKERLSTDSSEIFL